jgi:lysyl-tRNA synthetase class 2
LPKRAELLTFLRSFFRQHAVMEVDTPVVSSATVTDVNIDSIPARVSGVNCYLQTSPEYFMKRLLAAGVGDIYYLGKAFRDAELGPRHNPEFTLLEWYRLGWNEFQLMQEIEQLIILAFQRVDRPQPVVAQISYRDCFKEVLGLDPHKSSLKELQQLAVNRGYSDWGNESRANCLDLLFSELIEPNLPEGLVFIYDYPVCQSALAQTKLDTDDCLVSRRFEVFLDRMELANGYYELTDSSEQRQRFESDIEARAVAQKTDVAMDEKFNNAMLAGLPQCSGVALGVDRLLMQLHGLQSIDKALPFAWDRC